MAAIAEVAEAVGHFPDVDLRPEGVTVRTASGEYGALSQRDVELARRISVEARRLQVEPDPSQVQVVGIAVAQDAGAMSVRSGPPSSGTGASGRARTSSIDTDAIPTSRSNPCIRPSLAAAGPTSTSACRRIRRRHGSRPRSRRADAWPMGHGRPTGGRSRRPRTTASISRPGRTSKTATPDAGRHPRRRDGPTRVAQPRSRPSPISPVPPYSCGEHAGRPIRDVFADRQAETTGPRSALTSHPPRSRFLDLSRRPRKARCRDSPETDR